ncbi:hypothetical protein ABZ499_11375 [Streptomyces sp. NPDC019990]|uniref:hypothetical protein n=1 Tax=Streptomyces sp. NPDC019990 TaxID=3154693 RepID=UPI0033CDD929
MTGPGRHLPSVATDFEDTAPHRDTRMFVPLFVADWRRAHPGGPRASAITALAPVATALA